MGRTEGSPLVRFFAKVNFNGKKVLDTPCWEWMGARHEEGYGQIWIDNRTVRAARYILKLVNPSMPDDWVTMHLCDNTPCVNPDHLVAGTTKENILDCLAKGRLGPRRDNRYSPELAEQIRAEAATTNLSRIALSKKYGMSMRTLRAILDKTRKQDILTPEQLRARMGRKPLSAEKVADIRRLYLETKNINEVSRRLDVTAQTVRKYIAKHDEEKAHAKD